jgi:VanZ family protein
MSLMPPVRVPLVSRPIRYGAVVSVAVIILLLSVEDPGATSTYYYGPFGVIRRDKWSHAIGYALFTATIAYALAVETRRRRWLALSVCLSVAFGVCVELIQWPIPYRTMSGIDAVANTIGSCLLAVVWLWITRYVRFGTTDSMSSEQYLSE